MSNSIQSVSIRLNFEKNKVAVAEKQADFLCNLDQSQKKQYAVLRSDVQLKEKAKTQRM